MSAPNQPSRTAEQAGPFRKEPEPMSRKPKQIAIYGKGGIGKSTTTSNI